MKLYGRTKKRIASLDFDNPNPHHPIDPSRPLEGEVVLHETLSHKPTLLCASHGAYAPWVAAVFDFVIRLASHPFMHPLLQAVGRRNLGRFASRDAIPLDLRFAWICVGLLCEKLD